jgi:uncharacterized protein (DUF58 family)
MPTATTGPTFPLVARRRIAGRPFGTVRASRRGPGLDLAGLRPYRPGDDFRLIDRHASARRSSLVGEDEFVVREHLTDESTRVVLLADRRATMALYPDGLPWLSKPAAVETTCGVILESASRARCRVEPLPSGGSAGLDELLAGLADREQPPPPGAFVFLLSDFLRVPSEHAWTTALVRRWDLVPVVIQDPTWEQSFPDVAGVVVPFADPVTGRIVHARLTQDEIEARRSEHEQRLQRIAAGFDALSLDWVLVSTSDRDEIMQSFIEWAIARQTGARLR